MTYIAKVRRYADGITTVHWVDDDCNEYISETKEFVLEGNYYKKGILNLTNGRHYSEKAWNTVRV